MIWALTQQELVRIKFEDGKYKMIENDCKKFFVIGVSWWVPDPFSKIIKRGLGHKVFRGQ